MSDESSSNEKIADALSRIAELLELKGGNRFRIRAYQNAAKTIRSSSDSIAEMVQQGDQEALKELPDIGEGIARVVASYVQSGRSDLLAQLEGEIAPGELFTRVPGIGKQLAGRIADALDISTLEELEQAAHDGRLREVEGFGPERVRNVSVALAGMLSAAAQRRRRRAAGAEEAREQPSVETLLDVDEDYRRKAAAGELRKIAPKRFNPQGDAWLPILQTEQAGWDFTALYSNTARAHELDKTDDWVVLYYERDGEEDQCTVVTETHGSLEGKRVVRGREAECRQYYGQEG